MDQTPTDTDIVAAADRCAARSQDGTITPRDVFWDMHQGSWRGYKGGHDHRPVSLLRISHAIRAAGYRTVMAKQKGYTTYKRP